MSESSPRWSVLAVWWSARRVLGQTGAAVAMLATLALEATIGLQAFIDTRQQFYLLMPYWALLWLAWAVATGQDAAIAPLVLTASLIAQTHFTYLLQTLLVVAAGLALYVAAVRNHRGEERVTRSLLVGLAVGLACWAQPLWDQAAGERNIGAVLASRAENDGIGWAEGAEVISGTVLRPPRFWLPGTVEDSGVSPELDALLAAWVVLAAWFALLAVSAGVAWRRRLRPLANARDDRDRGTSGGGGRGGEYPANHVWTGSGELPVDVADRSLSDVRGRGRHPRRVSGYAASFRGVGGAIGIGGVSLFFAMAAFRNVDAFAPVQSSKTASERVARPLVDQFAALLRRFGVTGPVVIDNSSRVVFGRYVARTAAARCWRSGARAEPATRGRCPRDQLGDGVPAAGPASR